MAVAPRSAFTVAEGAGGGKIFRVAQQDIAFMERQSAFHRMGQRRSAVQGGAVLGIVSSGGRPRRRKPE